MKLHNLSFIKKKNSNRGSPSSKSPDDANVMHQGAFTTLPSDAVESSLIRYVLLISDDYRPPISVLINPHSRRKLSLRRKISYSAR